MKESIQEILKELDFSEDQADSCFYKGSLKIPFEALGGHSVETFLKMAYTRGWIAEEEVRGILDPQKGEPAKNEDRRLILRPCQDCRGSGWDKRKNACCLSCLGSGVVWKMSLNAQ